MWRPTAYRADDFDRFREALRGSRIRSVTIHAIYLINCASKDREIRDKSRAALLHALRVGDGIGADGVVLHAGARKGEPHAPSVKRAGRLIAETLAESERCPLLLENTAGTQGPLGRDFGELAELIEAAGGSERLGTCLDSCHLLAAGFEIRDRDALAEVLEEFDAKVGMQLLRCVHVNDSKVGLGANQDRHATLGDGELGAHGLRVFLSEPAFDSLPAILETGREGHGPELEQIELARRLRRNGLAARRRRKGR